MSYVLCRDEDLINIANAIRNKTGSTDSMYIDDMPYKIQNISGGNGFDVVQLISPYSEDMTSYYCIDEDGNFVSRKFRDGNNTVTSPSFIVFPSYSAMANNNLDGVGYEFLSGGIKLYDFSEMLIGVYVDGSAPVVFNYIASGNEPT